jgi:Na+-driven multidrug efflux pump
MAAPLVLSFWMRSLFTFVDTIYASTLGDAAVAAIGLSIPLEFLMIACWVGVSTGLTSGLSRAMGAREGAKIDQLLAVTRRIVWCLTPIFVALAAAAVLWAPRMGLDPEVARQFAIYAGVLVGGSAFNAFWSILPDSIVKAHHDTRSTMWAGIWSNAINVVLNTLFTFVFHWGIFGIAFSTVIGRFGGLIYALRKAGAHEAARRARGLDTSPGLDPRPLRSILSLAVPSALAYCLMAAETSVVNGILAGHTDATAAIAAYGIYYRVLMFALMPLIATAVAVLPFVARRFGEGDVRAIRVGLRQAHLAGAAYSVAIVAPAMALGGPALARFLAESQVTAELTRMTLYLVPLGTLSSIPFFLCRPTFEGLQRGRPGLALAVLRYLILALPFMLGGSRASLWLGQPPLYGLVLGLILASLVASAVFLVWTRRTLRALDAGSRAALRQPVPPASQAAAGAAAPAGAAGSAGAAGPAPVA